METDIICIYCNKPWTQDMLDYLHFADCSYTPDCVGAEFRNSVDIHCDNCHKLIYKKELADIAEKYTQAQWSNR